MLTFAHFCSLYRLVLLTLGRFLQVASRCLRPGKCSINYPGPTGLGATFNRSMWYAKGHAMGGKYSLFVLLATISRTFF
jgi:hypothetical protein